MIAGTIASSYRGFFTPRGRAGLDVYTVSGAVALDVFSKAPYEEIAFVGFALRFDQPSPQVFSARSFLGSTMSCDVTERYSPRTPFSRPLSTKHCADNGSRENFPLPAEQIDPAPNGNWLGHYMESYMKYILQLLAHRYNRWELAAKLSSFC